MRNKRSGKCLRCHAHVPAGAGFFQRWFGGWRVRCLACVGKGNEALPKDIPTKELTNENTHL